MMTGFLKDLKAVALLADKATPGEWAIGPYGGIYKTDAMGKLQGALLVGESKSGFYENRSANEATASNAVNFIRTHHAEIAESLKDARRYRWLREQHWEDAGVFVVAGSKSVVKLGAYCPSQDRLDEAIDNSIAIDAHNSAREDGE